ncbi:PAS domain-containing protein [Bradyrhizobium prioriisuperbiae]|uniref:PAS domain-containing protein n=1 Tax=Bradyrhizobium prioriisuperbiae TaxID=2854389 RepID=UPI0028E8EA7B|nr:PAS domain-containing protein [Bradyrhizobium prioritasuperba]
MSDRDRVLKLGVHIQSAMMIASRLNLGFLRQLLSMALLELIDSRPEFDEARADPVTNRKSFNSEKFTIVGSWDWDLVADRIYADAEVAELFGVSTLDAELGASIEAFLPRILPEDVARVTMLIDRARRTGGAYRATYRLALPNGDLKHILAVGRVVQDGEKRAIRFPGTVIELESGEGTSEHSASTLAPNEPEGLPGRPRWRIE